MKTEKLTRNKPHQIYLDKKGNKVPGVTTVLGVLDKPQLIHWAWDLGMKGINYRDVRDKAADIGTIAHFMIECGFKDVEPDLSDYEAEKILMAKSAFENFRKFWDEAGLTIHKSEIQLVHDELEYGGTLDIVARNQEGKLVLIDIKSSNGIYESMFSQVAAYSWVWNANHEEKISACYIVRIGKEKDGDFEVKKIENEGIYLSIFISALDIYHNRKELKSLEKKL